MKTLSTIVILLLPFLIFSQSMKTDWQELFGDYANETFHDLFEATNGYVVAAGETTSNTLGGKDGYLVIYDYLGNAVMKPRLLGGKKDDVLKAITQSYDGKFYLVGSTKSKGKGKADGWLIQINPDGSDFRDQTFGGEGEDKLEDVIALNDGSILLVGTKNEAKKGDIWIIRMKEGKVLFEKSIGAGDYESVRRAVKAKDGGVVICGNSKKNKGDVYLTKIDIAGNVKWSKPFGEKGWEEAKDLISTNDGGFALTGWTGSRGNGGVDVWMLKVDEDGFKQWDRNFGGRDDDEGFALTQTFQNEYFLLGKTKSHAPGARQNNIYLIQVDAGGTLKREIQDIGGKKEDSGKAILQLHDGSLAIAAETQSQGSGGDDAWLIKYEAKETKGARSGFTVETSDVTLNTHDGKLKVSDKSFLSFSISNKSAFDLEDVQVRVNHNAQSINVWERNFVGSISKDGTKEVQIPIEALEGLQSGENEFNVSITSGSEKIDGFSLMLESKVAKPAAIEALDFPFTENNLANENVTVEVRNSGDFPSEPVFVRFQCPTGIQALSELQIPLGNIPAGGSSKADFNFKVTNDFRGAKPSITYVILEGGAEKIRKTVTAGEGGGVGDGVIITWIGKYDEADIDIESIRTDEPFFKPKARMMGRNRLSPQNTRVLKNGVVMEGSKMDSDVLSPPSNAEEGLIAQNYEPTVKLEEGENRIKIEVETPYGTYESKEMIVYYDLKKANLHLLTIGAHHSDLNYTNNDANDIAAAFAQQEGLLFEKVFVKKLTGEMATSKGSIVKEIARLKRNYTSENAPNKIHERDVVMVFISSHGSVIDEDGEQKFKLRPSDYDVEFPSISSIDYRDEVLAMLDKINCKKLVFIDACQSGGAKSALAEALVKINQTASGLSTMTSCQAGELSYEDANWENGAFTEAILEALNGAKFRDNNGVYAADIDNNNELTLGELYQFLRRRVPQLVGTKADATTTQVPFMPAKQLDEDMPIFVW